MTTTKHKAYSASISTVLSTEFNSLATASNTAASSAIDNRTTLDLYDDLTLTLDTQGVARSAGAVVNVYRVDALDESNYDRVSHETALLVAVFKFDAATTATQETVTDVPIPPGLFKYFARNVTGQTLAASANLLERRPHSVEST